MWPQRFEHLSRTTGSRASGQTTEPWALKHKSFVPLPVVVLCMHSALLGGLEQTALLAHAGAQGLADGRLVFLPYDTLLFALPYHNHSYPILGDRGPLQEAYDAVLTVSLESIPENEAFAAAGMGREVPAHLELQQVGDQILLHDEGGA